MKARFADTFFFLALLIEDDEAHDRAVALAEKLDTPLLTTVWVLVELANYVSRPAVRKRFAPFLEFLERSPWVTVIAADDEHLRKGIQLYNQHDDKAWSLTDCISFVIMRERGLTEALTGDHHFEQAGFIALLK